MRDLGGMIMAANPEKDPKNKRVLGRGLAALMSDPDSAKAPVSMVRTLPIEKIIPCATQPRRYFDEAQLEELSQSIAVHGLIQPIVVRKQGTHYEIVAGERRWRAAGRAGLQEVPVVVREFDDSNALQVALIENIQRADLDPLEEAQAFERLIDDFKLTHEQVAHAVGRSRVAITNALRLLAMPPAILAMMRDGKLTAGHARALLMIHDIDVMVRLATQAAERGMSVREVESRARALAKPPVPRNGDATPRRTPAEREIEENLQQTFGARVKLKQAEGRGHIEIYFDNLDALDSLLDRFAGL